MTFDYAFAPTRTIAELREQAARLQGSPDFPGVRKNYIRELSAYREASRPVAKLIANEDRYRALNFFFFLWAEHLGTGGTGAITYGELFEICRRGEVTPRVLKTMLAIAEFSGFVIRSRNPADGRSWLYAPTPAMIAFPQHWLMPAANALDTLLPGCDRSTRLREDPGVLVHFYRSGGREFAAGVQPMTIQPEFMTFFGVKEGGAVFTMALLIAEMDGERPPSRTEIAQRYGLTKSQVTKLVVYGEEIGLLTVADGIATPTDALRHNHAEWVALSLAFLDHHIWPIPAH